MFNLVCINFSFINASEQRLNVAIEVVNDEKQVFVDGGNIDRTFLNDLGAELRSINAQNYIFILLPIGIIVFLIILIIIKKFKKKKFKKRKKGRKRKKKKRKNENNPFKKRLDPKQNLK